MLTNSFLSNKILISYELCVCTMTCKISRLLHLVCIAFILLTAFGLSGCCGRKIQSNKKSNKKIDFAESLKKPNIKDKAGVKGSSVVNDFGNDIDIDLIGKLPLRPQDERTNELYEKFNYANKMFKNSNYDAALREINRIQQEINNDPYLEVQTWALTAAVYDKTGKTSRRKRAYTKMIEAFEVLLKDSRYKKAYEDGMACQDFATMAAKKGDKKYGVFQ